MNEIREELLGVYSQAPAQEVHASNAYQTLLKKYPEGSAIRLVFDYERDILQEARELVDAQLGQTDPPRSQKHQVEMALRLLRRRESNEKKEAWRELIRRTYAKAWQPPQLEYFEKKSELVMNGHDYFLSFTSRNPAAPNINVVNRTNQYFIIESLGRDQYDLADKTKNNLVAETVQYHLKNSDFTGFYFKDHEGDNTQTKEKLRSNCVQSLAFVQLVQTAMFRYVAEAPNWCFFEYETTRAEDDNRILFVLIEEKVEPQNLTPGFNAWYQRVSTVQDPIRLKETLSRKRKPIDDNRKEILDKLTSQIKRTLNRIYSDIPE